MGKGKRQVHWVAALPAVAAADPVTTVADEQATAVAESEQDSGPETDSAVSSVPGDSVVDSSGPETDESAIARREAKKDGRAPHSAVAGARAEGPRGAECPS